MVFSGLPFLYLFFPLVALLYFAFKNRTYRNTVLLLFSLFFYAWGEPKFVILMILSALVAYVGGIAIKGYDIKGEKGKKKAAMIITAALITLNLLVFKYLNFFLDNLSALTGMERGSLNLILPIGISFYTFQILSYVIDLYKNEIALQKNFFYLLLYVCFFPQLIAGPIVRYQTVEEEILTRKESFDDFVAGLKRFIIGLSKKIIIANNVSSVCEIIYRGNPEIYGSFMFWVAAISYALQIYFDFSGYSDMAIGMGRMFGFHFLENFNYPYISLSITDFWRRWHISLGSWFRDYIYIPLGGNRVKKARFIFNIMAVWALTGFWHGASWNFVIWGLYYGVLLLLEKLFLGGLLKRLPRFVRWGHSMFFVLIGWVIFNLTDFSYMSKALGMMFNFTPTDFSYMVSQNVDILKGLIYIPLGLLFMFPVFSYLPKENKGMALVIENLVYLLLFIICIIFILSSTYNPFIYFRF